MPRSLKLALGLAVSALFLYATLATVPVAEVSTTLARARTEWLLAALGFVALAYLLKIARWTAMLRSLGAAIGLREAATPFLGGVAFNNVLPFRAGDLIRVLAFQRFTGIAPAGQLGTLLLERLLDLLVLMTILFATLSFWPVAVLDATLLTGLRLAAAGAAAAILLFVLAPMPVSRVIRFAGRRLPRFEPVSTALIRLLDAVQALGRPLFLLRMTALSLLAWLAEAGVYFAVGHALGIAASAGAALLALSIGTLATLIPSSPGYVGTFHFFAARAVAAFGIGPAGAAAYAILVHAILWIATTASGFLLLAVSGFDTRRTAAAAE